MTVSCAKRRCSGRCGRCDRGDLRGLERLEILAAELDGSRVLLVDAGDEVEDGGLAGAVRTDEPEDGAVLHGERDVTDARRPPKFFVTPLRTRSDIAQAASAGSTLGFGAAGGGLGRALLEQLALAEQTFGPEDHERDEHHRVHDHAERVEVEPFDAAPQILDDAARLQQLDGLDGEGDEHAADGRAGHAARAAEDDHGDGIERGGEVVVVRVHGGRAVAHHGHQATGDAGADRGEHEGRDLVARGIDADRGARDLVLAERAQGAAPAAELDAPRDDPEHERQTEDPERTRVERHALVVEPLVAVLSAEARERRADLGEDADLGPGITRLRGRDHEAEDLREAERDDREVVALEPQARKADQEAKHARHARRRHQTERHDDERLRERDVAAAQVGMEVRGHDRARVAADAHEAGVTDRELPRHAVDDVQRERDQHVAGGQHEELPDRAVGDQVLQEEVEEQHRHQHPERDARQLARPLGRRPAGTAGLGPEELIEAAGSFYPLFGATSLLHDAKIRRQLALGPGPLGGRGEGGMRELWLPREACAPTADTPSRRSLLRSVGACTRSPERAAAGRGRRSAGAATSPSRVEGGAFGTATSIGRGCSSFLVAFFFLLPRPEAEEGVAESSPACWRGRRACLLERREREPHAGPRCARWETRRARPPSPRAPGGRHPARPSRDHLHRPSRRRSTRERRSRTGSG